MKTIAKQQEPRKSRAFALSVPLDIGLSAVAKSVFNAKRMLSSSRCPRRCLVWLALVLVATWSPGHAQSAHKVHANAPARSAPLSVMLGGALGAFIVGAVVAALLARSRRKAPTEARVQEDDETFALAPAPLCEVDSRERFARTNAAWHTLLGHCDPKATFGSLLHPDDLAPLRVELLGLFDGEARDFCARARFFRPDGTLVTTELHARALGEARKPERVLLGLHDISELEDARRELDGARTAIRCLYDVMAGGDKDADLNAKVRSLLALGCGRLELPVGTLSRVVAMDEAATGLETVWVQSPDRRIRPALRLARGDASYEAHLLGLPVLPPDSAWSSVPCVAAQKDVTYIGAPVEVNGQWFGMLAFSSPDTTRGGFESSEVELLGLMAQWVGGEIERFEAKAALEASQAQMLAANQKLEELATVDPLTEAKNRRAWNEKLLEEWSRSTRYGTPLSLVMLDVDHFKEFNDSFGHQAGDEVLQSVARAAMGAIRLTDFFARYGGEEFALLLPNTDANGALILAERLRSRIEAQPWKHRPVTASFGVATLEGDMKSADELARAADEALYGAKESGRNRVVHAGERAAKV